MQVREFDLKSLDKLLPCPFCGGDAELDTAQSYRAINGNSGDRVVVYCTKCDADMGTCVEDVPDIHPNEVIERWNRRADTSALAARLRSMEEALKEAHEAINLAMTIAQGRFPATARKAPLEVLADAERKARAALAGVANGQV